VLVALFISYQQIKSKLSPQSKKDFQVYLARIKEDRQD